MIGRLVLILVTAAAASLIVTASTWAQDADLSDLARAGVELYEIQDYDGAVQVFEQAVVMGARDPVLYYDLAVAYMRTGRPALAVLNYRRSLALDPSDPDAASGLEEARSALDGVRPPPAPILERVSASVMGAVPAPLIAVAAVVASLLVAVLWGVFRTARRRRLRLGAAYTAVLLVLVAAFAATMVFSHAGRDDGDAVLPRATALYSGPGPGYVELLTVPAGAEVSVVNRREDWVRLRLPPGDYGDDVQGWARAMAIELVLN